MTLLGVPERAILPLVAGYHESRRRSPSASSRCCPTWSAPGSR